MYSDRRSNLLEENAKKETCSCCVTFIYLVLTTVFSLSNDECAAVTLYAAAWELFRFRQFRPSLLVQIVLANLV